MVKMKYLEFSIQVLLVLLSISGSMSIGAESTEQRSLTAEAFFDWAEKQFPGIFPGPRSTRFIDPWAYRYYPKTENYIGVADGQIGVLGTMSQGKIRLIGKLNEFYCDVYRDECLHGKDIPENPYARDSIDRTTFNQINRIRVNGGFGGLDFNEVMLEAGKNHQEWNLEFDWLEFRPESDNPHIETEGEEGFTGEFPSDRCIYAASEMQIESPVECSENGASWSGIENFTGAVGWTSSLGHLMNMLDYHWTAMGLTTITREQIDSINRTPYIGYDAWLVIGADGPEGYRKLTPEQEAGIVGIYPYDGMENVSLGKGTDEEACCGPKTSVLLQVADGVDFVVEEFTLRIRGTTDVVRTETLYPGYKSISSFVVRPGFYGLKTKQPLKPSTAYVVEVHALLNGESVYKSWSFHTGKDSYGQLLGE